MDVSKDLVASGYNLVYEALARSPTLERIWRDFARGPAFPVGFEHISFLTLPEAQRIAVRLRLVKSELLVDLGCGAGGPGLLVARSTEARLVGIDVAEAALAIARQRAEKLGFTDNAEFRVGSFDATGLQDSSASGIMSVDALQYSPDKMASFREAHRILRPGGRLVFTAFEIKPSLAEGLPVIGIDPVEDLGPPLVACGFELETYEETDGWKRRLLATYQAVADSSATLIDEMGEQAFGALAMEVQATLDRDFYTRRVFVVAVKSPPR